MNILQINKFYNFQGGADKHFIELSELLKTHGHQVYIFSTQDQNTPENKYKEYWPKYFNLAKNSQNKFINILKIFYNWEAVRNLKKMIQDYQIDIAHVHNIYHHLSPAILKVLKKKNIPIVMTVHDYKLICPNYNLFNFQKSQICEKCHSGNYFHCYQNKCIQNSKSKSLLATLEMYWQRKFFPYHKLIDQFIAPSQFMKDKLLEFNFPNQNIKVLYNFNNRRYSSSRPPLKSEKYFLYFGRLAKEKGLEQFIRTISNLKKDFLFYIIGQGPEEDNLKKLVKELNLTEKVKFLGYYPPEKKEELNQIISQAQFIVIPSIWYENCSLSIIESITRGKIVLASNLGGNSELINKQNGILYNPNNKSELLDKITILIDNRESIPEVNQVKKREFESKFNSEEYYQKLINIYNKVIK
jgi:glycosyltransferase involved in cell wall biosynthesis